MSNGIKSPVETTGKIRTYLVNLIEELESEKFSIEQTIDVATYLDDIVKKASEYVKKLKKDLPLDKRRVEIEGSIGRARYAERETLVIDPADFKKEVNASDFLKCISVSVTKAKKVIPEARVKDIASDIKKTPTISFQFRG